MVRAALLSEAMMLLRHHVSPTQSTNPIQCALPAKHAHAKENGEKYLYVVLTAATQMRPMFLKLEAAALGHLHNNEVSEKRR